MEPGLVLADLLRNNVFFMQKLQDRLSLADAPARNINSFSAEAKIAVCLWQTCQPVSLEHDSDARRVMRVHLEDSHD
jgi:hypothetical protein